MKKLLPRFIGGIYFDFIKSSAELPDKIESYRTSMYFEAGFLILLGAALQALLSSRKASQY